MQIKKLLKIAPVIDNVAMDYIHLKHLEQAMEVDEELADAIVYGKIALSEAHRIQEEFFPMSENSEEIVMTLLNQKFVYDEVNYSEELNYKTVRKYCDVGMLLYVAEAIADEINKLNNRIKDLLGEKVF